MIQDFVFLHGHEQDVHLRIDRFEQLIIKIHVGDIERNVLAGFALDAIEKFFLGHLRQRDSLHDHRVSRNRSGYVFRLGLLRVEHAADRARHKRRVHDGAVHHGVLGQRLQAETYQLVALLGLFELDGLH